jgi:Predicted hydrolase (HAD superfamily)
MKTKETYKSICNDLGVKPIDVIHVGDSLKFDYIEPRKAGIKSYYLDRSGVTVKAKDVVYDLIEFANLLI